MKTYRYLYYNLYCIWLKKKNEQRNARINAVITISFLLYVNVISIPLILLAVYKKEIISLPGINTNVKMWIVILLITTYILNYIFLGRNEQHNKVIEEFKSENEKKKRNGLFFTVLYLIVSLGIPLFIFFFVSPK